LRHVTGDPHFRPYLLRHSFATWSFAALLLHDSKLLQRALVRCPQTAMWVAQGKHLGLALLDTPVDTDNRGITALTRLMGHLGSAMTLGAYVHTLDMARAHYAERATGADIPKVVLASAAQMPVSTALAGR
jgi:integrase